MTILTFKEFIVSMCWVVNLPNEASVINKQNHKLSILHIHVNAFQPYRKGVISARSVTNGVLNVQVVYWTSGDLHLNRKQKAHFPSYLRKKVFCFEKKNYLFISSTVIPMLFYSHLCISITYKFMHLHLTKQVFLVARIFFSFKNKTINSMFYCYFFLSSFFLKNSSTSKTFFKCSKKMRQTIYLHLISQ